MMRDSIMLHHTSHFYHKRFKDYGSIHASHIPMMSHITDCCSNYAGYRGCYCAI